MQSLGQRTSVEEPELLSFLLRSLSGIAEGALGRRGREKRSNGMEHFLDLSVVLLKLLLQLLGAGPILYA